MRPRHTEELAAILLLRPATVSFHLSQLSEAGLLRSEKDQYYQMYSLAGNVLHRPLSEVVFVAQPDLAAQVKEDAYREKVLETFVRRGRLTRIPRSATSGRSSWKSWPKSLSRVASTPNARSTRSWSSSTTMWLRCVEG